MIHCDPKPLRSYNSRIPSLGTSRLPCRCAPLGRDRGALPSAVCRTRTAGRANIAGRPEPDEFTARLRPPAGEMTYDCAGLGVMIRFSPPREVAVSGGVVSSLRAR